MIVHDLDVGWTGGRPAKANSKLIVHADAMLSGAVTCQGFQTIARRNSKILEKRRDLQLPKLAPRGGLHIHEPTNAPAGCQCFGVGVTEGDDHRRIVTRYVIIVKPGQMHL